MINKHETCKATTEKNTVISMHMKEEEMQEYNFEMTGMLFEQSFVVVFAFYFLKALSIIHQGGKEDAEAASPVTFKER